MDREKNRLSRRVRRYASVGTNVGGVAARYAGQRFLGFGGDRASNAAALAAALGGLKGPLMKVAQMLATIPEAIPAEYAAELRQLQSHAPAMGWPFVKRRMAAELGADWRARFAEFGHDAAASASLGQVHRAIGQDGRDLACKLQYPDMDSTVEADLSQLELIFAIHRRMEQAIDTRHIGAEIGSRLREELDYTREARHMALYAAMLEAVPQVRVPGVVGELSTRRLLTMDWMAGRPILDYAGAPQEDRNRIAQAMFRAWWHPFSHYGVIHGDPHLGNYTVFEEGGEAAGINLLDYGCVRIFGPEFVGGVVDLYHGLRQDERARIVHAYETWGFSGLSNELIDILNIWARFIYGPLLDDRVRSVADGVKPAEYGRRQAFQVHRALREKGPVTVPREFVFMDRAAIGLGGVFVHLGAELNFFRLFNDEIADFSLGRVSARQSAALAASGLAGA
ncbi:MAG TPA: AarF/ABC1/UbiB kinase family protein [Hyphomicrobiales bacterium]|nr:AarF/ABC1/UbiB kinase family protein [Hyphomicrobiales bacterium]